MSDSTGLGHFGYVALKPPQTIVCLQVHSQNRSAVTQVIMMTEWPRFTAISSLQLFNMN